MYVLYCGIFLFSNLYCVYSNTYRYNIINVPEKYIRISTMILIDSIPLRKKNLIACITGKFYDLKCPLGLYVH